ncbi:unnamed protein product [Aphanomyces euteiches]
MSASNASTVVCVTGGTGFVGSHVVKALLDRGYTVNTTVRNMNDEKKLAHLKSLPGATERLRFFQADLVEEGSFDEAIKGTTYVLHTASPFFIGNATRENILDPAVDGTLTCMAAVSFNMGTVPSTHVYTEADWSREDLLEQHSIWYPLGKTIAERTAHEFVEKETPGFSVVALNPTWIFGPLLQPTLNESSQQISRFFTGDLKKIPNAFKSGVDVRDLAIAHVAAFEKPAANGRYVLIGWQATEAEICARIKELYPSAPIATEVDDDGKTPERMLFDSSKAVKDLGLKFTQMAETIAATCQSLVQHGFVQTSGH